MSRKRRLDYCFDRVFSIFLRGPIFLAYGVSRGANRITIAPLLTPWARKASPLAGKKVEIMRSQHYSIFTTAVLMFSVSPCSDFTVALN